jgi:hypothetical protein
MSACVTYHYDSGRAGWFTGSGADITPVNQWRKIESLALGSAVRGAPLFLENWTIMSGPHKGETHDLLFTATSGNQVSAHTIDQAHGRLVQMWSRTLHPAIERSGSNIPKPLGICSTPVLDPANSRMFVMSYQDEGVLLPGGGGGQTDWVLAGNTIGFGDLLDGQHRNWAGHFTGSDQAEVLFHYAGDGNWWLGSFSGTKISFTKAGNTTGFGNLLDGNHGIWVGHFDPGLGPGLQILFYYNGDGNWWLGSFSGTNLSWTKAGNTAGFGNLLDGNHQVFIGNFAPSLGTGAQVLFYYNGDGNWWLGSFSGTNLSWTKAGNTAGFGNLLDGNHAFWVDEFTISGQTDVLFYYNGDGNWWLGSFSGTNLSWTKAGNSIGFGDLIDGRHRLWSGKFRGLPTAEMLFYYNGDGNWWLGAFTGNQLGFSLVGNSAGFGNLLDGQHLLWSDSFGGGSQTQILFYFVGDGNWWLGTLESVNGHPLELNWIQTDNTGGTGGKLGGAPNFGNLNDGKHLFLAADFTNSGRIEILFNFTDGNWWLRGFAKAAYHIVELNLDTGAIVNDIRLFDAGASGRPRFDAGLQDQRGALNLAGNRVLATFADFYSDDDDHYHGWVVACEAGNLISQTFFSVTRTIYAGGVWGPGGTAAASDGTLYFATGNGSKPGADGKANNIFPEYWTKLGGKHPADIGDFFESVVRLTPDGTTVEGSYTPADARKMNEVDLDIGGSSVMVIPPISSHEMVVFTGKVGDIWLLDTISGRHFGGEMFRTHVFSNESKCAPAFYVSQAGDRWVYVIGGGTPGLVAFKIVTTGSGASFNGSLQQLWPKSGSPFAITLGDAPGSPLVMRAPGTPNEAVVWIVDETIPAVRAFDALSGAEVYNSSWNPARDGLGAVPHFAPLTCAQSGVFVGTNTGIEWYGG